MEVVVEIELILKIFCLSGRSLDCFTIFTLTRLIVNINNQTTNIDVYDLWVWQRQEKEKQWNIWKLNSFLIWRKIISSEISPILNTQPGVPFSPVKDKHFYHRLYILLIFHHESTVRITKKSNSINPSEK